MDRSMYTIAWLCALPIEMAMAMGMLDEQHPDLHQMPNDDNKYALGRIGPHNIVIASLPAGTTGIGPAATVAAQTLTAFPAVKFGILVGIGGGAPSPEHDIRLGDVVVSQPSQTAGGVIQYDSGKMLQDGQFLQTGSLNRPPAAVLAAVSNLQAKYLLQPPRLSQRISALVSKYPHLQDTATYQGTPNDVLYKAEYIHQDRNDSTCDACDDEAVVERTTRPDTEPRLFYGLIASGNAVVRDSSARDRLQKELGILCFEMEAAGLMNTFPCLVVRGICDYSDSHKNKKWQPYAAATAAAYAKELLAALPSSALSQNRLAAEQIKTNNLRFARNHSFLGREAEIGELKSKLFGERSVPKVALYGLGGIGKTQIALELAYQLLDGQPDYLIFWIVGTSLATFEQSYLEIAKLLGLSLQSNDETDVKLLVQQELSQMNSKKWFMIIDNADDLHTWFQSGDADTDSGLRPLVDFLPQNPDGRFLFTTRNRKAAIRMAGNNNIHVKEMAMGTAENLLVQLLLDQEAVDDQENVNMLVEQLNYLPLALAQAAAYINSNGITISTYLSLVDSTETGLIEVLSEDFDDEGRYRDSKNPVAATWLISFDHIRKHDRLAEEYLSFMACLEYQKIPRSLLPKGDTTKEQVDAIGTLKAFSFISERTVDSSLGEESDATLVFDMHRLVHLSTRSWLKRNKNLELWIHKSTCQLLEDFPSKDYKKQAYFGLLLPHANRVLNDTASQNETREYLHLMEFMAKRLCDYGKYREAGRLVLHLTASKERMFGAEHPRTIASKRDLAYTYYKQGRLEEAESLQQEALALKERSLEEEDPAMLTARADLATTLRKRGQWTEAEELQTKVLSARKRVLGEEHRDTLHSMSELASIYYNQGRWIAAEELRTKVLATRKRLVGEQHPDTITTMGDLARTLWKLGRQEEAEQLLIQVLDLCRKVYGNEHPETLSAMASVAVTYGRTGRFDKAAQLEIEVLEVRRNTLGAEHPATLSSMSNLSATYLNRGLTEEGESLALDALEKLKVVLGVDHPKTLTSMTRLAMIYAEQDRWDEAGPLQTRALEMMEIKLGLDHPATLRCMSQYANMLRRQGQLDEARNVKSEAIQKMKAVLGVDHPKTIKAMKRLADGFKAAGDIQEATQVLEELAEMKSVKFGPDHLSTLETHQEKEQDG